MAIELTDKLWAEQRDLAARRFYDCDAKTFVERFEAGQIDDSKGCLQTCLAFFPELD